MSMSDSSLHILEKFLGLQMKMNEDNQWGLIYGDGLETIQMFIIGGKHRSNVIDDIECYVISRSNDLEYVTIHTDHKYLMLDEKIRNWIPLA